MSRLITIINLQEDPLKQFLPARRKHKFGKCVLFQPQET